MPINEIKTLLDALRDAGLTEFDIARRLELHQVRSNPRTVRHWYSGKTTCRNVEFRALRDLLAEVNND